MQIIEWGKPLEMRSTRSPSPSAFKMMTIEGSYVSTLGDLRELLALAQTGKVPPIPLETRPADQASSALTDLKSGGKVRGRVVLHHR